ncbi:MAG: hypothetical protein ACOX5G_05455 [Kiritimatiellia bacterium]|jgi:hypothetical protein
MVGNPRSLGLLVFASSIIPLAVSAQPPVFDSAPRAWEAFQKAEDDGARRAAYGWMTNRIASAPAGDLPFLVANAGKAARVLGDADPFSSLCRGCIASADPGRRAALAGHFADWLASGNDVAGALEVLEGVLGPEAGFSGKSRYGLASKAAGLLSTRLSNPADADRLLSEQIPLLPGDDPETLASALAASAVARSAAGDDAGALARADEVEALGGAVPPAVFAQACEVRYRIALGEGRGGDAADAMAAVLERDGIPPSGIARKIVDAAPGPERLERCVSLLRGKVPATAPDAVRFQSMVERVSPEAVELLLALGRPDEALKECRAFALSASPRGYAAAVDLAARAFKTADGNLGRAAALIAFHTEGPAASNPLLEIPAADDADRAAVLGSLGPVPPSAAFQRHLERARLLLWLDRPADSLDSAAAAFAVCPMREEDLRACAQAAAYPVLVLLRDEALSARMVSFLLHGPQGADGAGGTADDIADPFPEARARLACGAPAPEPAGKEAASE